MFENSLKNLINNFSIKSIKFELGSELIEKYEDYFILKLINKLNIPLTFKISGVEALGDIIFAKKNNANAIVAPMIESGFALTKFVNNVLKVYSLDELDKIELYINIETLCGKNNINDIFLSEHFKYISGIVFGRNDYTSSVGLACNDVDSDYIYNDALFILNKCMESNKKFRIGGNISSNSYNFLKNLNNVYNIQFETRKVIFDNFICKNENIFNRAIACALNFEILLLEDIKNSEKNKTEIYSDRIKILKKRVLTNF